MAVPECLFDLTAELVLSASWGAPEGRAAAACAWRVHPGYLRERRAARAGEPIAAMVGAGWLVTFDM
jgi:hypothetical protein